MHAIILAAGKGTRLLPMTEYTPKPLIEIHKKPIMAYQLDALYKGGIDGVTVVVGYLGESTKAFVEHYNKEHGTNADVVVNNDYDTTNNMYSLWLAREKMKNGSIVSNGDVIYSANVIKGLLQSEKESAFAVAPHMYDEESMKVQLRQDGTIHTISKKISEKDADATSIDLYKFSSSDAVTLLKRCDEILHTDKNMNDWTEVAIQDILNTTKIYTHNLNPNDQWIEIDTHADYDKAHDIITPPSTIHRK